MKQITRRLFGKLAAAAPLMGAAVSNAPVVNTVVQSVPAMPFTGAAEMPLKPLMPRSAVMTAIRNTPWMMEKLFDEARAELSRTTALDPDIEAKKSWSPCIKHLTQRERNIRRYIEGRLSGSAQITASLAIL